MLHRVLMALLLAAAAPALAETVYRTVDAEGNVTFTDEPPPAGAGAEEITIDAPPPSPQRVRESQQEAQEAILRARRDQIRRDSASKQRAIEMREAERALEQARKNLEEAKVVGPGDRIGRSGGGTRLTEGYLKRVEAAEKAFAEAQQRLDALK